MTLTNKVRTAARLARRAVARPDRQAGPSGTGAFGEPGSRGTLEKVYGHPLPTMTLEGWFDGTGYPLIELELADGTVLEPNWLARKRRPDLVGLGRGTFAGFAANFALPPEPKPATIIVGGKGFPVASAQKYSTFDPPYAPLLNTDEVLGRNQIYGQGPPTFVHPEIKEFCALARGSVLDFGCGNGDLVVWLRNERGLDAVGIELDSDRILADVLPEAVDFLRFYQGGIPLPYADNSFDTIIATEVIEHLPGFEDYVPEFIRILKPGGSLLVTVPDISSVPLSSITMTVPWHLLEATHLNFFTHESLAKAMRPLELEERFQILPFEVSGRTIPLGVGAVFSKAAADNDASVR